MEQPGDIEFHNYEEIIKDSGLKIDNSFKSKIDESLKAGIFWDKKNQASKWQILSSYKIIWFFFGRLKFFEYNIEYYIIWLFPNILEQTAPTHFYKLYYICGSLDSDFF